MKKMKGLLLLIIGLISLNLNMPNTLAKETAIIGTSNTKDGYSDGKYDVDGIEYSGTDGKGNTVSNQKAHETNITVSYNGKEYTGYCPDLNKTLNGAYEGSNGLVGSTFSCEEVFNDAAIGYILNSSLSTAAKEAALRARDGKLTISGSQAGAINSLIEQANSYANSVGNSSGSLNFLNKRGSGQTVTYDVYASGPMANGVTFTCGAGCSSVSGGIAPGASNGTVTITLTTGACNFTILYNGVASDNSGNNGNGQQMSSGGARTMQCTRSGQQKIYFTINEGTSGSGGGSGSGSSGSGAGGAGYTGSFSDSIDKATGGAYYDEYCDGNEPDKKQCNDTTVSVPGLCDKSNATEKITIHESDRIKSCIINGLDEAGNSYQMIDGQINPGNPYCAVYCKEEYEMTLPSAKFTNSGRYFELEPVKVHATRKCYASNPLGRDDKQEILVDEFVKEITELQKNLIDTFNEYQEWNAIKKSADKAVDTPSSTQCPTYTNGVQTGSNTVTGNVSIGPSEEYKVFTYRLEDAETGRYVITGHNVASAHFEYGIPAGCPGRLQTGDNGDCDKGCVAGKVAELAGAVNELRETIRQKIEYMEECYKWVNELCLNTQVEFDYGESYNNDINFTLVEGGGTFTSEDAKYHTNKNIDEAYSASVGDNRHDYHYAYCDIGSDDCNNDFAAAFAEKISTMKEKLYYRKIEVEGDAYYENIQEFQTNIPHGTIDTLPAGSQPRPNYSYLGAVFPVALERPTGVYQWTLDFSNLGQYNQNQGCSNGRLDQVLAKKGYSTGTGLEYVCVYVVDCDDCDYECVDPSGNECIIKDPPSCPECDVYCENCIFDGDGATFFYATKTLHDWNPADRQLGANWSNEKGETTRAEIEATGENVYINAQYTYILDASNMKEIRDYNERTKTYVEEDLDFHDLGGYANVYGTSYFLRDQRNEGRMFTTVKRNESWQLWNGAITTDGGSGPAWKVGS